MNDTPSVRVLQLLRGQDSADGAGVNLSRILGTAQLRHLDPFLLLDELKSDRPGDYVAGFPEHPHRGFETVTYLLAGCMEHRDHLGNRGLLEPGGAQWMTAGKGVIHSEMPRQQDGLLWSFQLWVNLPAKDKLCPARYQDLAPGAIPEVEDERGVVRRVVAGDSLGVQGAVTGIAIDPLFVDLRMPADAPLTHPLQADHQAMLYCYRGSVTLAGELIEAGRLAVLSRGEAAALLAGPEGAGLLLIAGRPIGEPIVQYGPFVMTSMEEIQQAVRDYNDGTLV